MKKTIMSVLTLFMLVVVCAPAVVLAEDKQLNDTTTSITADVNYTVTTENWSREDYKTKTGNDMPADEFSLSEMKAKKIVKVTQTITNGSATVSHKSYKFANGSWTEDTAITSSSSGSAKFEIINYSYAAQNLTLSFANEAVAKAIASQDIALTSAFAASGFDTSYTLPTSAQYAATKQEATKTVSFIDALTVANLDTSAGAHKMGTFTLQFKAS